jgi:type IV fimbrial biogenesis protein FimT
MHRSQQPGLRGFTLIELMLVVAVVAVIIALAAPAFTRMIEMQRLRGVNAQLVTDMQFARSEAIAKNRIVGVSFNQSGTLTCYTIYTTGPLEQLCDCRLGAGNVCPAASAVRKEIKTVQVMTSTAIRVEPSTNPGPGLSAFGFDPTTGGLVSIPTDSGPTPLDAFGIDASLDAERELRNIVSRSGRPTVCAPTGSSMPEMAC